MGDKRTGTESVYGHRGWINVLRVLSADCTAQLLPFLGLPVDASNRKALVSASRKAYSGLIGNAKTLYTIDFASRRIATQIDHFLVELRSAADERLAREVEDFGSDFCRQESGGQARREVIWSALMIKLRSSHPDNKFPPQLGESAEEIFAIHDESQAIVEDLRGQVRENLSGNNISEWDKILLGHTPEIPSQLEDLVDSLLDSTAFARFWYLLKQRLPEDVVRALTAGLQLEQARLLPGTSGQSE